jgi:hypothetical protein
MRVTVGQEQDANGRTAQAAAERPAPEAAAAGRQVRLLVLSFLMLFLELMLIRWGAANVLYLAYFTNPWTAS